MMSNRIKLRMAPPDDPIYSTGYIIGSRRVEPLSKDEADLKMAEHVRKNADKVTSDSPVDDD